MLAAQPALPTGIVNKPAEFIKLLWELSTVNSGGTYLFYQLLADGTGLPPALFDQNGVATLTLVATIRRVDPGGGSVRLLRAPALRDARWVEGTPGESLACSIASGS